MQGTSNKIKSLLAKQMHLNSQSYTVSFLLCCPIAMLSSRLILYVIMLPCLSVLYCTTNNIYLLVDCFKTIMFSEKSELSIFARELSLNIVNMLLITLKFNSCL